MKYAMMTYVHPKMLEDDPEMLSGMADAQIQSLSRKHGFMLVPGTTAETNRYAMVYEKLSEDSGRYIPMDMTIRRAPDMWLIRFEADIVEPSSIHHQEEL